MNTRRLIMACVYGDMLISVFTTHKKNRYGHIVACLFIDTII